MAMELQIISPKPEQRFPAIKWNYEELKTEIAAAMQDYQNLVVTPESEKDCKETKAKLNKLRTAIETARKDMKKKINEPLVLFERQIKEVEEPIDTAIANLDAQLKEIADAKKEQKRKDILTIWEGMKRPNYLTIDKVWNERWLNATYSMKQVTEDLTKILAQNQKDVEIIGKLPEYSFEAMHYYSQTLDVQAAIARAQEHAEMDKRKAEQKAESEPKKIPEVPQNEVQKQEEPEHKEDEQKYTFRFEVTLTAGQAKTLGDFCRTHEIKLTQI